jgi:hypothetical protein
VFFFLVHMVVRRLARVLVGTSSVAALEVENAVLRHQLAVLERTVKRPRLRRRDRLLLALAAGLLPRERWSAFVVSPQTLLRWQRELVARKVDVPAPPHRPAASGRSRARAHPSSRAGESALGLRADPG